MSGYIQKLSTYSFSEISIYMTLGDASYHFTFDNDSIEKFARSYQYVADDVDSEGIDMFLHRLDHDKIDTLTIEDITGIINSSARLKKLLDLPMVRSVDYLFDLVKESRDIVKFVSLLTANKIRVVYLPTYRRIEADITKLIKDINNQTSRVSRIGYKSFRYPATLFDEDVSNVLENNPTIRFGMKDIDSSIDSMLKSISQASIKGFSNLSGTMLHRLLSKDNNEAQSKLNIEEINIILQRVGQSINETDRQRILEIVMTDRLSENPYLAYFLDALVSVYRRQQIRDTALKSFAMTCNKFLVDKQFYYDESHVSMGLFYRHDTRHSQQISLDKLSSGEKQLVALMAMAHLELNDNLIFLIDEPELSLSLQWQELLLPELLSASCCKQILAVTHSPFIFSNELEENALGSIEYMKLAPTPNVQY